MQYKLKQIRYFFGRVMLRISGLIAFFPNKTSVKFARTIGKIAYFIFKKKRRIAMNNLRLAFGDEKSAEELERIAYQNAQEICRCGIEIFKFVRSPTKVEITINGKENLDAALCQGNGIFLISAHFGNFPVMIATLAQQGYKVHTVMRSMHDLKAEDFFVQIRKRLNISSIMLQPRRVSIQKCLAVLRKNMILVIPIDQHAGAGGVFVRFFAQAAATPVGPIVFALRTGAPILPVFMFRDREEHILTIESATELCSGDNMKEVIKETMAKFTKIVESYVRRYPEQWNWIHKRWK